MIELMKQIGVVTVLVLAGATIWWVIVERKKRVKLSGSDLGWLPRELVSAKLMASEEEFVTSVPISLGAVVDRLYEKPNKQLVLVELKTREREQTFASDVMELSAQRMAVEGTTKREVADIAYVLVMSSATGTKKALPVRLVPAAEVVRLVKRREAITTGGVRPTKAEIKGLCERCGHLKACNPSLGVRGQKGWFENIRG